MPAKVVVVALDKERSQEMDHFGLKPVVEKIHILATHIENLCHELKSRAPNAMWVVTWCEYGISEGLRKGALTPEQKSLFKKTMAELTSRYPNLIIVAGTIQSSKKVYDKTHLSRIKKYYALHDDVVKAEQKFNCNFFSDEKRNLERYNKQFPQEGVTLIRNSCFIFHNENGKTIIQCHDKSAPVNECGSVANQRLGNPIFQPAKDKNKNMVFEFKHHVTGETIRIAIEICQEHYYRLLKQNYAQQVYLQLVLSDYVFLTPSSFSSKYVIQIDPITQPRLIMSHNHDKKGVPITVYTSKINDQHAGLVESLSPVRPFMLTMLNKLRAIVEKVKDDRKEGLAHLAADLAELIDQNRIMKSEQFYDYLTQLLNFFDVCFKNKYHKTYFSYFLNGPNLERFRQDLLKAIKVERLANPEHNDIHPIRKSAKI